MVDCTGGSSYSPSSLLRRRRSLLRSRRSPLSDEALLLIVNREAHPVRCHVELTRPGAGLCEETRLAFVRSEYDYTVDCFDDTHIALHDGVGAFDLPPCAAKIYRLENRHGTETGS